MNNTIVCKHCGKSFEITEALEHQIGEQLLKSEQEKHLLDLEQVKAKAREESTLLIKQLQEASLEEKERTKKLQEDVMQMTRDMRKVNQEKEDMQLTMQKKLAEEEEKIKLEARRKADEEHQLKDVEKDKKLTDMLHEVEELKRRLQQGSQQSQGESLELLLEETLRREFPEDRITEVKKGERGADITQEVVDKLGRECGTILWESKNAQWSETWLKKLREDQREAHAQLAVLVSVNLPTDVENYTYREGVWITSRKLAMSLALALRFDLIHLHHEKLAAVGKNDKMEVLYDYLRSVEFKHRIEAVVEAFNNLQDDIEKEKRWFSLKWARQEKELRKIIDNTHGMYGELQAVTGRQLQEIKPLENGEVPDALPDRLPNV